MLLQSLVLIPFAAGCAALLTKPHRPRRVLLTATALAHFGMTATAVTRRPVSELGGLLALDALGILFLGITSLLFLTVTVYGIGYLGREHSGPRRDFKDSTLFTNAPEAIFTACLLFFLAAMSLVCLSGHLGMLWAGIETTTLASAPLIYFHRHNRSLEASWKYLMICSVGIALALIGNILLYASLVQDGPGPGMFLQEMIASASAMDQPWFKAGFLFIVVGYGTKMGLAPLHTWLPDAHSESPSVVSALLSGALLNCAFLGILRAFELGLAAGQAEFCRSVLIAFGVLSMGFAAVFIINQGDFKRLLAYSSVEHMGILSLGVGLGGIAVFGAMLHTINHSIAKCMLFLLAGNIMQTYRTRSAHDVRGVLKVLPVTGVLWIAGFLAIAGIPPFGLFVSEFTILTGAVGSGRFGVAAAYLVLLTIIFAAMAVPILRMAQGSPIPGLAERQKESVVFILPPMVLAAAAILLGLTLPLPLHQVLTDASSLLGVE
jgi:hydrogenase-4 component F